MRSSSRLRAVARAPALWERRNRQGESGFMTVEHGPVVWVSSHGHKQALRAGTRGIGSSCRR